MAERILFLTGRLAEKQLNRVLESMHPTGFAYKVEQIGISVAALMTVPLIERRVRDAMGADKIMVPGRMRGDLEKLSSRYRVPVVRGPEDLKDLPEYFGHGGAPPDLSRHDTRIFAEIVDAPLLDIPAIVARARAYQADGADVIDLGCLPDTPFPKLEQAVAALKADGFAVSVDSADLEELRRGGKAGADYLLSLNEDTLALADEVAAVPVLIPSRPGDLESLFRAIEKMQAKGRKFLADPILDPIHFGFTESVVRYHALRRRFPEVEILMGLGNLTELTGADTVGITATLMGVASELSIKSMLVVQVSPHARRAVKELDVARRIMFRAREDEALPIGYSDALLCLHARRPYSFTPAEIAELAAQVRDPSFRIQVGSDGIHIFNRDGLHSGTDPFALFPKLKLEDDGAHAFYIGVELARAQTAWQLGKSYSQDEELDWGVAADKVRKDESKDEFQAAGHTLAVKREKAAAQREKTREKSRAKTAAKPAPARKARLKTKPKPKAKR
jgi:dihydropteroate synthase